MVQDFPLSANAATGSAAITTSETASIALVRNIRSSLDSSPGGSHRAMYIVFCDCLSDWVMMRPIKLIVTDAGHTARQLRGSMRAYNPGRFQALQRGPRKSVSRHRAQMRLAPRSAARAHLSSSQFVCGPENVKPLCRGSRSLVRRSALAPRYDIHQASEQPAHRRLGRNRHRTWYDRRSADHASAWDVPRALRC